MTGSRKAWLKLSAAILMVPAAGAQAQTGPSTTSPSAPNSTDPSTPAPPGGAPASTTSPQGPNTVGQAETAQTGTSPQSGLGEIVITAQQRGENLQRAAVAVAAVSGADLINSGVRGIDTLGTLVPSLVVQPGSQGNLVFIRGVGNFSFTPNSDPAAAYNYDGVYIGRSSSTFGSFYDLERVEVLKGPQGTLYGRNATAGAINVLPVQPRLGETSGYATASYGNYDAVTAEGAINLGIGDTGGFRLSGSYANHDGYLRDGTQNEDNYAIRAQLKGAVTPNLTVRLEGDYAELRGTGSGTSYVGKSAFNPATGQFLVTPSGLPLSEGLFTPRAQAYRVANGVTSIIGRPLDPLRFLPFIRNEVHGLGLHVDLKTAIGTFSLIPAWRHGVKDNLSTDSAQAVGTTQTSDQYSIEARLVSNPGGIVDYNLGAYYFSEVLNDDLHNSAGTQATFTLSKYKTHSPAAYGRITFHATNWLRFTGGLRYTEDHKSFTSEGHTLVLICAIPAPTGCPTATLLPYTTTLSAQPVVPAANGALVPVAPGLLVRRADVLASGSLRTNKVTYRGAVELDVGPRSLLYASIETGYRAGGFNPAFNYAPETITAYTIGSKNRFLNNRVQLNLELFEWKYRGQQISYLGIDPLGRIGILTQNIGRSTIKGAEVDARLLVTRTTTLSANVQYLDAKYNAFRYSSPARPFNGCSVTQTTTFTIDCSGKPAINSPKWTVNLGAQQVIEVGDYQVTLSADTQYRSGRYNDFDYIAPEYVKHSWASNAQISIGTADGKYVLGAFVRNIENNRVNVYATPVPASNLIVQLSSAPRTYGVRLSTRF